MFRKGMANLSPKGETFKHFEALSDDMKAITTKLMEFFTVEGETLRERFKSHKYMKNNIYINNNINLSPIHPPPPRATRYAHARIETGWKGKDSMCRAKIFMKYLICGAMND